MPVAKNGRGVQRLVWVDEHGVQSNILLAYLGTDVIWDGHIHQTLQAPTAMASAAAVLTPLVGAFASVGVEGQIGVAEMPVPAVTGGVTILPPPFAPTTDAPVPVLHAEHVIDAPITLASSSFPTPDVQVLFGVAPPPAAATSDLIAPQVFADALVVVPVMTSFGDAHPVDAGAYAIVEPPLPTGTAGLLTPAVAALAPDVLPPAMTSTAAMPVPAVQALAPAVDATVAVGTADMLVPTVLADVTIAAPVMTATAGAVVPDASAGAQIVPLAATTTAQMPVPEIYGSGFTRQRMNGSATIFGSSSATTQLNGYSSDGTHPATVTGGNSMTVSGGGGGVTATASIAITNSFSGVHTLQIRKNNTVVASRTFSAAGTYTLDYVGAVANNDALTVWVVFDVWGANVTITTRSLDVA